MKTYSKTTRALFHITARAMMQGAISIRWLYIPVAIAISYLGILYTVDEGNFMGSIIILLSGIMVIGLINPATIPGIILYFLGLTPALNVMVWSYAHPEYLPFWLIALFLSVEAIIYIDEMALFLNPSTRGTARARRALLKEVRRYRKVFKRYVKEHFPNERFVIQAFVNEQDVIIEVQRRNGGTEPMHFSVEAVSQAMKRAARLFTDDNIVSIVIMRAFDDVEKSKRAIPEGKIVGVFGYDLTWEDA